MISLTQLAEDKALCERVTGGTWTYLGDDIYWKENAPVCHMRWTDGRNEEVQKQIDNDAEFIARSRAALPAYIDEVQRLRAELVKISDAECYGCEKRGEPICGACIARKALGEVDG